MSSEPPAAVQIEFFKTVFEPMLIQVMDQYAGAGKWSYEGAAPDTQQFLVKVRIEKEIQYKGYAGQVVSQLYLGNLYKGILGDHLVLLKDKQKEALNFLQKIMAMNETRLQLPQMPLDQLLSNIVPRIRTADTVDQMDREQAVYDPQLRYPLRLARPELCSKLPEDIVITFAYNTPTMFSRIVESLGIQNKLPMAELFARSVRSLKDIMNDWLTARAAAKGKKSISAMTWSLRDDMYSVLIPKREKAEVASFALPWLLLVADPVSIVKSLPESFMNKHRGDVVLFPISDSLVELVKSHDVVSMNMENTILHNSTRLKTQPAWSLSRIKVPIRLDTKANEFVLYQKRELGEAALDQRENDTIAQMLRFAPPPPSIVKIMTNPDMCNHCQSRIKLKLCAGCKKVRYCSVECQRADWDKHKEACKRSAALKQHNQQCHQQRVDTIERP